MKKSKGSGQYIAFTIVLVVILAVLWYLLSLAVDLERSREIYAVMREYSLKMESNGSLTEEQQHELLLKLAEQGVTDIIFNVNPLVPAAYGEEVVLSITGTVPAGNIIAYKDFKLVKNGDHIQFTKTIRSTAQY